MKNPDLISKRILSISIGITMVLLSVSLLLFSLEHVTVANADDSGHDWFKKSELNRIYPVIKSDTLVNDDDPEESIKAIQTFGLGIREGSLYFGILYSNNSIGLHKAPADGEDVLDW